MSDENNTNPVIPNEDEGAGLPPAQVEESKPVVDENVEPSSTENDEKNQGEAATAPPSSEGDSTSSAEKEAVPEETKDAEPPKEAEQPTEETREESYEEEKPAETTEAAPSPAESPVEEAKPEEEKAAEPVKEEEKAESPVVNEEPESVEPVVEEPAKEEKKEEEVKVEEEEVKVEEEKKEEPESVEPAVEEPAKEEKKEEEKIEEEKKEEKVEEEKKEEEMAEPVVEEPAKEEKEKETETPVTENKEEEKPVVEETKEEPKTTEVTVEAEPAKEEKEEKEEKTTEEPKAEVAVSENDAEKGAEKEEKGEQEQSAPEKSEEGEKEAPKAKTETVKPKAPISVISRLKHLQFEVVASDSGEDKEFPVANVLLNERDKVYSTVSPKNVNIVLKSTEDNGFVATHFIVRAPEGSFSAPVHEGLIFVSNERLSDLVLGTYDNFTRDDYLKLMHLQKDKPETETDETIPVAFFDMAYSKEQLLKLPNWKPGKYVTVKLISSSGDKANIDIEFIGVVGFDADQVPSEGYELGKQVIVDMGLIAEPPKFTSIKTKEDVRTFQHALRSGTGLFMFFVNNTPAEQAAEIIEVAEKVANQLAVDDNLAVFLTGEESELKSFAEQSRPALGFPLDQSPLVAIYSDNGKYAMPANVPITETTVTEFVNGYKNGTLKRYLRSAKRPENDSDPKAPGLTICTASSFEEIVLNENADVLVHFFVEYEPIFITLSRVLSGISTIITAQFDLEENDVEKEHFDNEPPLFKFYPKSSKQSPVVYNGPIQGDSLLKFIHDHCDEKFDLPAKQREFEMLHPILIEEHKKHANEAKEQIFRELRADPEFTEIRLLLQQRPELAAPLIQQWIKTEPFFARLIMSYGEEFIALLQEPVDPRQHGGGIKRTPDGRMQITVTPEQMAVLNALMEEGFEREEVLEAFIHCGQDAEATVKLLRHGIAPPGHEGHGHGHAHGHGHGHGHGSRFSPVDDDTPASSKRGVAQGSPLTRTPITPHPTKSRKKKKVALDWTAVVFGVGVAAAVGVGAYYWFSKKE